MQLRGTTLALRTAPLQKAPQGLRRNVRARNENLPFPGSAICVFCYLISTKRSIHDRQGNVKYDVAVAVHAAPPDSSSSPTSDTTAIYVGGVSTWHGDASQDA
jgi:hypothetical protein